MVLTSYFEKNKLVHQCHWCTEKNSLTCKHLWQCRFNNNALCYLQACSDVSTQIVLMFWSINWSTYFQNVFLIIVWERTLTLTSYHGRHCDKHEAKDCKYKKYITKQLTHVKTKTLWEILWVSWKVTVRIFTFNSSTRSVSPLCWEWSCGDPFSNNGQDIGGS